MSFGNILGQILQDGLGQSSPTRDRVTNAGRNLEATGGGGGGGMEGILGQIQEALGRAGIDTTGAGQAAGGFADKARDFLQKEQVGSLSGGQIGGIGALAGAVLGGGIGGAARGGAMAILGTLALSALRSAQAKGAGGAAATHAGTPDTSGGGVRFDPEEVRSLVAPDNERLVLQAMITAAKADGQIDRAEMGKVVQRLGDDDVTAEEKAFVMEELKKPIDIPALARGARTRAQAAELYAASLLAIHVDTAEERAYLGDLAAALGLDAATVAELHRLTGAPA